jgi:hypothetical protein
MTNKTGAPRLTAEGEFNYITNKATSSLFRNDQVMIQRNEDGDTTSSKGVALEPINLSVTNARTMTDNQPTCEKNGFELRYAPLEDNKLNLLDQEAVLSHYYEQCAVLVAEVTGAKAYAFDHNVRSATGKKDAERVTGGQGVQGPAHLVHGDYTLISGPERLRQLGQPPSGNDTLRGFLAEEASLIPEKIVRDVMDSGRRFSIINVWRNISEAPVVTHPMALCDAQTVQSEELVVFEIHYSNRIGENYFSKYSSQHKMYYYPEMTRDEALLIKQWDSAGPLAQSNGRLSDMADSSAPCTFSFHSAFLDPTIDPNAPDRWSIEVRCMVIYDS